MSLPDGEADKNRNESANQRGRSTSGWFFLILSGLCAALFGYQVWRRVSAPTPPTVELQEVDPDIGEAIAESRARLNQRLGSVTAWADYGMTLQAHGYYAQAVACYERAEKLQRDNPQWPYLRSLCLTSLGSDGVIPCLEQAAQGRAPHPVIRLVLGERLLEQDRIEEAEAQFLAVLAQEPLDARAHLGLARVARSRNDFKLAVSHLEKSIASDHRQRETYELLAAAYHALGEKSQAEAAREQAEQAAKLASAWPDPYLTEVALRETGLQATNRLANGLLAQGNSEAAIALFEQLVEKRPESVQARASLGRLFVLSKRPAEAVEQLNHALRLDPNLSVPHFYLGAAYFELANFEESAEAFERSIELQPNHADAHYEFSRTLIKLGNRERAVRELRECLRLAPNSAPATKSLGILLLEQGELQEAELFLEQAAKLAPQDPEIELYLQQARRQP